MADPDKKSSAIIVAVAVAVAVIVVIFIFFVWPNMDKGDGVDIQITDPTEQIEEPDVEIDIDPPSEPETSAPADTLP